VAKANLPLAPYVLYPYGMGRAQRGDQFTAVFGAKRGLGSKASFERYSNYLERQDAQWTEDESFRQGYQRRINAGDLDVVVAPLREHLGEIENHPWLMGLRGMLTRKLLDQAQDATRPYRESIFLSFGAADATLNSNETVDTIDVVMKCVTDGLGENPRRASDAPKGPLTAGDMLYGMCEHTYLEETARHLSKRVLANDRDGTALVSILGAPICRQLVEEAEGADEMPLQRLFDDGALPSSNASLDVSVLRGALQPHHWRDFISTQVVDGFYEGKPRWSKGCLYAPRKATEGLRGETPYKLARLVRKCSRAQEVPARI